MPSGSHSGRSGSHSSGGSSSGRHSSGVSRSRSHSNHGNNGFGFSGGSQGGGYYFGTSLHLSKWAGIKILALFLLFFAVVAVIAFIANISTQAKYIDKIKTDTAYYQNMVSKAKNDSNYVATATISDIFYNEDAKKWYIEYECGSFLRGYSYSVYTEDEAFAFNINDNIQIAINSFPITTTTDSMPMDFEFKKLTDDGEYLVARDSVFGFSIGIVIVLAVGSLSIFLLVWSQKKQKLEKNENIFTSQEKPTFCKYCGAQLVKDEYKCRNCGANNSINKK